MISEVQAIWQFAVLIFGFFAVMGISALLAHPARRELMVLGEDIRAHRSLSKYERDGIDFMLDTSTSFFTGFLFLLTPIFALIQHLAGAPEMAPILRQVPRKKAVRLAHLSFISVFAANPFVGIIWAPLYAIILGCMAITHAPFAILPFGGFLRGGGGVRPLI